VDTSVFEPEFGIDVGEDFVVGFEDIREVYIDKIVERVDVLFD
jgi:hypothetical protein